ncbi:MAG: hypothetical protein AB1724_08100 [Thermodesulfobacteriota bacterium]
MALNKVDKQLFCCSIGDVTLEIRGEPGLDALLTIFRRRMTDFGLTGEGKADLTLNIILSGSAPDRFTESSAGAAPADAWIDLILRRATALQRRLWEGQRLTDLKTVLTQPAITPWLELFLQQPDRPGCVPLETGFLLFDLSRNNWILLMERPPIAEEPDEEKLWLIRVTITIMNAVMCLLSLSLSTLEGVVVHAVGLKYREGGYAFAASSGNGKTSLSMQSPPGTVLADDGLVIRRRQDGYTIYPTPFRQRPGGGKHQWAWHQQPVPLTELYLLEKSGETRLGTVSRTEAIDRLLKASTHFFTFMDPESAVSVFDFWRALISQCPVARLQWRKGDDFFQMMGKQPQMEVKHDNQKRTDGLAAGI